jgi:hypothetical protein
MTMTQPGNQPGSPDPAAGDAVDKTETQASQGVKTGHIRWVLVASLSLGILALGAAFLGYTASQHHPNAPSSAQTTTSGQASG